MVSQISKLYKPDFKPSELPPEYTPRSVVLETTFACNMRCRHCGTSCGDIKTDELSLTEHLQLASELASLGTKEIFLSGGEALMNPDWITIANKYDELGVRVVLLSNGLLIPKNIEAIKKAPLDQIAISIDGMEKTHDHIRKVKGSFKKCLEAITLIEKQTSINTSVITTVSKWNISELEDLYQALIAVDNRLWQLQRVFPTGRMDKDFILDFDDIEKLHKFIHDKRQNQSKMIITAACDATPFSKYNTRDIGDQYMGCPAGLVCLGIEANGNVKGCLTQSEEFIEGNVRKKGLTEIWNNPYNFAYNRFFHDDKVKKGCVGCAYLEDCRCGCAIQAFAESGDRYDQLFCLNSQYFKDYNEQNK
ncbi:MAG: radical SAM protein [Bacteriovoracaceae bacterium]|nr:radical SAM protein [Bacteriovoracaceae bacterium]